MATIREITEVSEEFSALRKQYFFDHVIFSYQWWILMVILLAMWVIWVIFVDKRRLNSILLVGIVTSLIAVNLDDIGLACGFWIYAYHIAYFSNQLLPVDIATIPVFYMLLYQYLRSWKSYVIVLVILSIFAAFVVEPLFVKMNIYIMLRWEHWFSTPFYILIGVFAKWMADKLEKHNTSSSGDF